MATLQKKHRELAMDTVTFGGAEISYASLFENMIEGLAYCRMIYDEKGLPIDYIFLKVSENFEKLTGLKEAEGKRVTELIPRLFVSNPENFEIYGRVSTEASGRIEKFEIFVEPISRWFSVSVFSLKKGFFVAIFQNITEYKRANQNFENTKIAALNVLEDLQIEKKNLAEANAKNEAMLLSMADGVIILDLTGKVNFINQSAERMLGWKNREIAGKLLPDVIPIENEKGLRIDVNASLLGTTAWADVDKLANKIKSGNYFFVRKNKTRFPMTMTFSRVFLEGKPIAAIEMFRDYTAEREIDKAKTEFVSLASHQLRTPLTAVNWYCEMLLEREISRSIEQQEEYLAKIHSSSERMISLVNALLNASRIELGTIQAAPQTIDLIVLLQEIINEQKLDVDKKKITLSFVYSPGTIMLSIDPGLLRMVFQNLLSNAIKYNNPGGRIDVSVVIGPDKNVLVTFSDTGYGIPRKDQEKIFSKMFRSDNVKEREVDGNGLGLYIVKSVLTVLGGTIRFESEENNGSKFFILLPLKSNVHPHGSNES